jgi:cardiolipin synthase A/B
MINRMVWLLVALVTPALLLLTLQVAAGSAALSAREATQLTVSLPTTAPYDVIINEWSQGNGGSKEWVELLVVNGPLDLRGWDLGDNTPGDLTFANSAFWSQVSAGSLIVIYNAGDRDTILPPDDQDLTDCVVVLPHTAAGLFTGSWPAFANNTPGDNPHLRDNTDATVHDFSEHPGLDYHPGANQNSYYTGITAVGVSNVANWTVGAAATAAPGAGNNPANANWIAGLCQDNEGELLPDLALQKSGPITAVAGSTIQYQFVLSNIGQVSATGVILTDFLPPGFSYSSDDSGLMPEQPAANLLVWTMPDVYTNSVFQFNLTVTIAANYFGTALNQALVTTAMLEANLDNNSAMAVTAVTDDGQPVILIDAILYDGYELNDADEAVRLWNVGSGTANIGQWQLGKGSSPTATLPANVYLSPGSAIWLAKNAFSFERQFGFLPDYELESSVPALPKLSGGWPQFSNDTGSRVLLLDKQNLLVDVLIYKNASISQAGWSGPPVYPYRVSNVFAEEGQILYRMRDQSSGRPVPDSNTAVDWAQSSHDVINGRKVQYPGWRLDEFFFTAQVTQTAVLTVAIAPDNAYEALVNEINRAQSSLQIESLTFENIAIADALIAAVQRGVSVTVLLEGGPPGGIPDQERYVCQRLETAGGQCWFMINESGHKIYDRYSYLHAKFILIDGQRVIISSENLSPNSLPADDKSDGTWGRRGVVLITDAPGVVAHVQALFAADFNPAHRDILRWQLDHDLYGNKYGAPPPEFVPITVTGGTTYTIRYPTAVGFQGTFAFELVQAPENALRDQAGLLGLIQQAGAGDTVLVQQLNERPYWGPTSSNALDDPNPRLEAYLAAARRGARVRLLLDGYFDDSGSAVSNQATCTAVNRLAHTEGLDLGCELGNPAGLGIHNKMVLVAVNGRGYIHIGSLNGTENSHKANRELALQVQSDGAYALLAEMFNRDWPHRAFLPLAYNDYIGPAAHLLISEVLYDPPGADDAEFIELVNPTGGAIDISGYTIGDAVNPTDYEDMRLFPPGTIMQPGETLVIATSATVFAARYGFKPHFEVVASDTAVPTLAKVAGWGHPDAILQLGNQGDELLLRDATGQLIDVLVYGSGFYPGVSACPLVSASNRSLERYPFWRHSGNCAADFREWPFPNPGSLPQ